MGISKILDKKYKKSEDYSTTIKCVKNITDCKYIAKDGKTCSAEWCIYNELPKMITEEKEINCILCDKSKTVSIYSSESSYICPECKEIIDKIFKNSKCQICGNKTNPGQFICENCAIKIKGSK